MPQIKGYERQTSYNAPRGVDVPEVGVGRGVEDLGRGIQSLAQSLYQKQAANEATDYAARLSELEAEEKIAYQEALKNSDGSDPNLAEKLITKTKERISKLSEGLSTPDAQRFAQRQEAETLKYFTHTAISTQAELRAQNTVNNLDKTIKNKSAALMSDPYSFNKDAADVDATIDANIAAGMLPAVKGQELKKIAKGKLIEGFARGRIQLEKDPIAKEGSILADLESGKFDEFLDSDLKKQLIGEAYAEARLRKSMQELNKSAQERYSKEKQEAIKLDLVQRINSGKLPTIKDVAYSGLDSAGVIAMTNYLEAQGNRTDPIVFDNLLSRISKEDGDPDKIYDSNEILQQAKSLSRADADWLMRQMTETKSPEGKLNANLKKNALAQMKAEIARPDAFGVPDAKGLEQYNMAVIQLENEIMEGRKKGIALSEMLDPNGKNYVVRKVIDLNRRTMQERIRSNMEDIRKTGPNGPLDRPVAPALPPGVEPKKPGESGIEFARRLQAAKRKKMAEGSQ